MTGISPSPHFSSDVSEPDYLRRSHKCTLVFLLCLLSLDLPHWGGHHKCPSSRNPPPPPLLRVAHPVPLRVSFPLLFEDRISIFTPVSTNSFSV